MGGSAAQRAGSDNTATGGDGEVLRRGFDDPAAATEAYREALMRYPDCEVKLIEAGVVLISAGPAPPPLTRT
jgi:hypothetical protein